MEEVTNEHLVENACTLKNRSGRQERNTLVSNNY